MVSIRWYLGYLKGYLGVLVVPKIETLHAPCLGTLGPEALGYWYGPYATRGPPKCDLETDAGMEPSSRPAPVARTSRCSHKQVQS